MFNLYKRFYTHFLLSIFLCPIVLLCPVAIADIDEKPPSENDPGVSAMSALSGQELLNKASMALQESNYQGRMTYENGGIIVDTVELTHVVKDGVEYERLEHLNGPVREFVRHGRSVDCVGAASRLFRGGSLPVQAGTLTLQDHYYVYSRGQGRIAGYDVDFIQLVPKDKFRFGLTIAVEKQTALPLMTLVRDVNYKALERFQFVDLSYGDQVDVDLAMQKGESPVVLPVDDRACQKPDVSLARWLATWLPNGFVLSLVEAPDDKQNALMYTDGVATFSVQIEPASVEDMAKSGIIQRGATTALLSVFSLNGLPVKISLVGEIPPLTAQRIVRSIRAIR